MTLPDVLQDFELDRRMDRELLEKCRDVIDGKSKSIDIEMSIENCQRTFGSTLSYHLAMKYNEGNHFSDFLSRIEKQTQGKKFSIFTNSVDPSSSMGLTL